MQLKFFSKIYLEKEHLKIIKKYKRKRINQKIINHNGNFVEHIVMEKSMKVVDKEDEILRMIEDHIEATLDDVWFDDQWRPKNYDFNKLPFKLRAHIKMVDEIMYHAMFRSYFEGPSRFEYDERLDRLLKMKPEYTSCDFEDHVLIGKSFETPLGKKAKDSARRAYKQVNGLLKANINKFEHFVTLTFAPVVNKTKHMLKNKARLDGEVDLQFDYVDAYSFDIAKAEYSSFVKNYREMLARKGVDFEYIAVWELQKNGAYHFHMLTTKVPAEDQYKVPSWLDYDHKTDLYDKGYGLISWKYGKSDVQKIKSHAEASTYMSKYILKSFYNVSEENYETYKGQKKYFASRGLARPIEKYFEEDDIEVDKLLEELKVETADDPYQKYYRNPYNDGLITNKIYTLVDIEKARSTM